MERDENTCREPFTHLEARAMMAMISGFEKEAAKERRKAGIANLKQNKVLAGGVKLTPPGEAGKTRDKVAAQVGYSFGTMERVNRVCRDGVPELIEAMDAEEIPTAG